MKNYISKVLQVGLAVVAAGAFAGCSSSGTSDDAGDSGLTVDSGSDTGVTPFFITPGDSCYEIVSVDPGANDGCDLGVADTVANQGLVGASLPFNYDNTAYTISVGTNSSLGSGSIAFNMATLLQDRDAMNGACTWHDHVDATATFTAQDAFTISASRTQSMFSAGCTSPPPPTGGTCTSTWTWHMVRNTKTPPACD